MGGGESSLSSSPSSEASFHDEDNIIFNDALMVKALISLTGDANIYTQHEAKTLARQTGGIAVASTLQELCEMGYYPEHYPVCLQGGGGGALHKYVTKKLFDPRYDYDFTNINDGSSRYKRAGFQYFRPCGWNRFALNVVSKYDNGDDTWLGMTGKPNCGEWMVGYHGSSDTKGLQPISEDGFKIGKGNMYGDGVYCADKIAFVERQKYAAKFEYKGKKYLAVFQNRVNVKKTKTLARKSEGKDYDGEDYKDYTIIVPESVAYDGDAHCQFLVTKDPRNVRPYGICLKLDK